MPYYVYLNILTDIVEIRDLLTDTVYEEVYRIGDEKFNDNALIRADARCRELNRAPGVCNASATACEV